ncbi:unnamed protein product [Gadus morhua 'NCC']
MLCKHVIRVTCPPVRLQSRVSLFSFFSMHLSVRDFLEQPDLLAGSLKKRRGKGAEPAELKRELEYKSRLWPQAYMGWELESAASSCLTLCRSAVWTYFKIEIYIDILYIYLYTYNIYIYIYIGKTFLYFGRRRLSKFKMSLYDSSDRYSESPADDQTEGEEVERDDEEEEEEEEEEAPRSSLPPVIANFSSSLLAVVRIRQKYLAMKKRRLEMSQVFGGAKLMAGAPSRTSPKIFTFDGEPGSVPPLAPERRKRRRKNRGVQYPTGQGRRAPPKPAQSRAKYCLYLLCAIVFLQVYNAIENLDDHVLRYDLDGLEKTLRREVFGQRAAVEGLLGLLHDYLSTYVHGRPLVLSVHGPSGVGKSHLGRLLAGHFRAVVGEPLVLQYYVLHRCPLEADAWHCARALSVVVAEMVERAEEEEKIPLFVFDEAEHMHGEILDALRDLVATKRSNEYLNAVYLFLSGLGGEHITHHLLHNSSSAAGGGGMMAMTMEGACGGRHGNLAKELGPVLRDTLEKRHPLWEAAEILPMGLLEKSHVTECFLDEMAGEGFYPDRENIERLAGEVEYYPAVGERQYARTGCKQVVAKVNLL